MPTTKGQKRPPLLQQIGNTPLLELSIESKGKFFAKLECLNPGGSIKDRAALHMIEMAEKDGHLKPGGVIVEGSSGNQGIAIAMIGAVKGYRVIVAVPQHTSEEKKATLRAYGADVRVCPDTCTHADPNSYHSTAKRIANTTPGSFMPNQFYNLNNCEAHYKSTGPEIWRQTDGKITHFITGMGSCGTISGVGKYLKEKNPNIRVIGIDSAHSLLSSDNPSGYDTEGIGVDVITDVLNKKVIDQIIPTYDNDNFASARKYAKEGILVGPSSGAVLFGAESIRHKLKEGNVAVCILADSGRAYLSKLFQGEEQEEQQAAA